MIVAEITATDVIEAACAVVFGVLTLSFGGYQFWRSGFRPRVEAWLAIKGDSMRVKVSNRGRAEGRIHGLDVLDSSNRRITLDGAGSSFTTFRLLGDSAEELDFNAPEGRDFQTKDVVVVAWGKRESRSHPLPTQVSFYNKSTPAGTRVATKGGT